MEDIAQIQFKPHQLGTTLLPQLFTIEDALAGPMDLTGAFITLQFRQWADGPLEYELSTTNGGISITDPTAGKFQTNEVKQFRPGIAAEYMIACKIVLPDNTTHEPFQGTWPMFENAVQ